MNILDDQKQIQKLKGEAVLESIRQLDSQVKQAFQEAGKVKIPASYKNIKNILINGMGGSGLGAHVFKSLFEKSLKVPVEIINNYILPGYVNKDTLYLACSYSGNTEEIVNSLNLAKKARAKIIGLASGGRTAEFFKKNKLPAYIFTPKFNPSNQPRLGTGYSVIGQIKLLSNLGIGSFSAGDLKTAADAINETKKRYDYNVAAAINPAKKFAFKVKGRIPIIVAAGHLAGNAHILANQINETGKNFSAYFIIPELNHHLLEGLLKPDDNRKNLTFIFLQSSIYLAKNQKRLDITKKLLDKDKIPSLTYTVKSGNSLSQSFEVLVFGSYLSFYLSLLNNVRSEEVPFVDFFKAQLKQK
ncbi:SIS domain-containing protein [Candidatus Parcubacteria bacterium]|nr:MAG: SIS domain-containing protein [Candidatus Parcubacteria bacterium]